MEFASVIVFLFFYYLRPHEWASIIGVMHPITLCYVTGLFGLLVRPASFPLRDLVSTPVDWVIYCFLGWILYTASSFSDVFGAVYPPFLVYFLTRHSLNNLARLRSFLIFWTAMILVISFLAVGSEYGFDPFDTYEKTHEMWHDRLVLHLSIFHNPNALGHSVVPVLGLVYIFCFWKRPVFIKEAAAVMLVIPIYCVYLTKSKGAYLAGFVAALVALAFKRPLWVKILIVVFAYTIGWAGMTQLPRMQQLNSSHRELGIQGRLVAFQGGLTMMEQFPNGVGLGHFGPSLDALSGLDLDAHCSYVLIGGELGYDGLFLFTAIIYCCLRTLITAKTRNDDEERIRRALMVLMVSYAVSSWFIGWGYRTEFYLIAGAVAAFHRYLATSGEPKPVQEALSQPDAVITPSPQVPALVGALPLASLAVPEVSSQTTFPSPAASVSLVKPPLPDSTGKPAMKWKRIGLVDLVLMWAATKLVIWIWNYAMKHM